MIGPHVGGTAFELGALGRDVCEPRLRLAQFLRQAHPGAQPAIALNEVIDEIPGQSQTQHGSDDHPGTTTHFTKYDHRLRESLDSVCVNTGAISRTMNKRMNWLISRMKIRVFSRLITRIACDVSL